VPRIEGIVESNGKPLAGVPISYSLFNGPGARTRPAGCDYPLVSTKSLEDGRIRIDEDTRFGIMLPFPANYFGTLRLCFEAPNGEIKTWDYSWSGPPSTPSYMKIQCDLVTEGVCRVLKTNDELWYPTNRK
jgi:hypothetical protein